MYVRKLAETGIMGSIYDGVLYSHWKDVQSKPWRWPNFTPEELASNGNGEFYWHEPTFDALTDTAEMKACIVKSCSQRMHAKGYCGQHYVRFAKYGDPEATPLAPKLTTFSKHRELFEKTLKGENKTDECILWTGKLNNQGYGQLSFKNKTRKVHTWMLAKVDGEASQPEMEAAHSCDVRHCINPRHLSWKTKQANVDDKQKTAAAAKRLTPGQAIAIARSGETDAVLAEIYGVSTTTVWEVRTGRTWSWATC